MRIFPHTFDIVVVFFLEEDDDDGEIEERREETKMLLFFSPRAMMAHPFRRLATTTTTHTQTTTSMRLERDWQRRRRFSHYVASFVFLSRGRRENSKTAAHARRCGAFGSKSEGNEILESDDDDEEERPNNAWELFYKTHGTKFFRDRHYLKKSFEKDLILTSDDETSSSRDGDDDALLRKEVLEIGVGVGNALFPLLRANPNGLRFHAADVSETAIEQLKLHEEYDETKIVNAFVVNAGEKGCFGGGDYREEEEEGGRGGSQVSIKDESFDVVLMCFFLSALTDEEIRNCLTEVRRVLRKGGVALVRDYADDDAKNDLSEFYPGKKVVMEEEREAYRRKDGTLARFFSERQMMEMFTRVGFKKREEKEGSTVKRVVFTQTNRKKNIEIARAFLEGRFVK